MDMENTDTEWKETWAPKNLKTIAAFYNTEGGRMIIGRRDDGSYIGVDDVKGTLKEISDTIHNKLHIACRIRAELEGELCCIAVDVPV